VAEDLYDLELKISKFLRAGVLVAGALLLVGWIGMILTHTDGLSSFHFYQEMKLADLWNEAVSSGHWPALVSYVGLACLISLPVLRVLLTSILFFGQREKLLGSIALVVLLLLLLSFSQGIEL
jgi:uncharacterized membrane protein